MQQKVLVVFLSYFLLMTYLHSQISSVALAWGMLVIPALCMAAGLVVTARLDGRLLPAKDVARQFVRYDWQRLIIAFAIISPVAASFNGSPLDAAATSLLCVSIVLITGGRSAENITRFGAVVSAVCLLGSVITYHCGTNPFGYLPWHEALLPTFVGVSRVSLFPSLSDSALFAVVMLFVGVLFRPTFWPFIAAIAVYLIFYSYSRTVMMMLAAMLASHLLLRCRIRGNANFLSVVLLVVFAAGFADRAVPIFIKAEKFVTGGQSYIGERLIRRLATRESDGGYAPPEVLRLYAKDLLEENPHLRGRAELWKAHMFAFASSPLIGVGRDGAIRAIDRTSLDVSSTGSESFLTRILAEFGIAALLFWAAIWRLFVHFDRLGDAVGQCLTVGLFVTLCLYGSSAVPYNFVFLCYVALIGHVLVTSPLSRGDPMSWGGSTQSTL